jgi:hypothetical protein
MSAKWFRTLSVSLLATVREAVGKLSSMRPLVSARFGTKLKKLPKIRGKLRQA